MSSEQTNLFIQTMHSPLGVQKNSQADNLRPTELRFFGASFFRNGKGERKLSLSCSTFILLGPDRV
jgi:hypothetical protein